MNKYSSYDSDQLEELFSTFLVDSWSFSKLGSFSRNEKAFEKRYIYGERSKSSSTTVAGNAYHSALELYFSNLASGVETSIVEMEQKAFEYIDKTPRLFWKLQKTTPFVEDCIATANKTVTSLIKNFLSEADIYTSEISEILGVELKYDEWLTINGVDIPLPCHAVMDIIVKLNDGRIAIIDHKSKKIFTDEKELSFTGGKQAITYVKILEAKTNYKVDEVWFVENKYSKNKDGSPQLNKLVITMEKDTRMLYESMLYEPLKRMLEAVSDPDYVYLINDLDTLEDKAELYDFWARTMIAEIEDFNVLPSKRAMVEKRLKKIRNASIAAIDPKIIKKFKESAAEFITYDYTNTDMNNSEKIEHVLRLFQTTAKVAHSIEGYSSDTFLLEIGAGVKVASVMKHHLDIANALDVSSVRIGKNLMVYKKKSYLSIEVSKERTKDLLFDPKYLDGEKLPLGIDNFGRTIVWDLNNHSTPHMLICGATGSGKSVEMKSIIEYAKLAGVKDIIILDHKREFRDCIGATVYNDIAEIEKQIRSLVEDMHSRIRSGKKSKILVVFDEFAAAVDASKSGKELDIKEDVQVGVFKDGRPKIQVKTVGRLKSLEENLKILLQEGRSLGFRIIAATQRASVKVITGDAKVNLPIQICFSVPKEVDSKVVLDEGGAELLAGAGDGLINSPQYSGIVRFQGFYKP